MRRLLNLFLYSNLLIAFAAAGLVWTTELLLFGEMDWVVASLVGSAGLLSYNFQRLVRFESMDLVTPSVRMDWFLDQRVAMLIMTAIAAAATITLFFFLRTTEAKIVFIFLGIISVWYAIPLIPKKPDSALRDLPFIKIFLIAISWVIAGVVLPIANSAEMTSYMSSSVGLLVAERFLFIMALTIPFDIRDLKHDEQKKKTLPQIMGVNLARNVALILLLVCTLLALFQVQQGNYPLGAGIAYIISLGVSALAIWGSSEDRSEYYYAGFVDGCMLIHFVAIWLACL